jgi:hypothetical protein
MSLVRVWVEQEVVVVSQPMYRVTQSVGVTVLNALHVSVLIW